MVRRYKRHFGESEKTELLLALSVCRHALIRAGSEALFIKPVYDACHVVTTSIDDLAGVLTGDRTHFHLKGHSTPPSGTFFASRDEEDKS